MSVSVRPYARGWIVTVSVRLPDRTKYRERIRLRVASKSAAVRSGEDRERHLLQHGPPKRTKEVPTFAEFEPRFMRDHVLANRLKPSGAATTRSIVRIHLNPVLGAKRLDAITTGEIQDLKARLAGKAPKTVNNILTVLRTMLKKAVEWNVIDQMPATFTFVRAPKKAIGFHDFEAFDRLVAAAQTLDETTYLIVLLGGHAGLRCGEIMALHWEDVDFEKRQLCVQRSEWRGQLTAPKGGRLRYVPMTDRLASALKAYRHLKSKRVICHPDGAPLTQHHVQRLVERAAIEAGVRHGVHLLRHTFVSHLALKGAPATAIQALAGHQDLGTTQRYMHLGPKTLDAAIQLLNEAVAT